MNLHGENIIGNELSKEGPEVFQAAGADTGAPLEPSFHEAVESEVDRALRAAAAAFEAYRTRTAGERADFLRLLAGNIDAMGGDLTERASAETGLPAARLNGERARTVNQIRMFAGLLDEGSWVDARIDRAEPERQPLPKPCLRRMLIPVGPVAVFGASNFPLAFSVCGGDTVTALAAGNPVVVKAHPAYPGTCEMLAGALLHAIEQAGMPAGLFSMVHGQGHDVGLWLVRHPLTCAVGFTGSLQAGRALMDAAAARPAPIPVFAEMGSVNPIFILPGAMSERGASIAAGLVGSVTLGAGQFCTNPGLVFGVEGDAFEGFIAEAGRLMAATGAATMLHAGICSAFAADAEKLEASQGIAVIAKAAEGGKTQGRGVFFRTDARTFAANPALQEEVFGPASIIVSCPGLAAMEQIARGLRGNLTATLHATAEDLDESGALVDILRNCAGRLVFDGYPTGVEVVPSMHHGGPYPASSDVRATSVGTAAIQRFVRPICYQNAPQDVLPVELRDANARGVWRLVDNERTREDC